MTGMKDCIFCKIAAKQVPAYVIYEDAETFAFLDRAPNTPGHALVIPKKHAENIFDVAEDTLAATMRTVRKLSSSMRDAVGAQGVNVNSNHGEAAGQEVMHLHFHIIPRFTDDGLKFDWPHHDYGAEKMAEIAAKIRGSLTKRGDAREGALGEEVEHRAAADRDEGDPIENIQRFDSGDRIAPANN